MIEKHEVEDMLRILMNRCDKDPKYCIECPFTQFEIGESCSDFGPPCSWKEENIAKMTEIMTDILSEVRNSNEKPHLQVSE